MATTLDGACEMPAKRLSLEILDSLQPIARDDEADGHRPHGAIARFLRWIMRRNLLPRPTVCYDLEEIIQ